MSPGTVPSSPSSVPGPPVPDHRTVALPPLLRLQSVLPGCLPCVAIFFILIPLYFKLIRRGTGLRRRVGYKTVPCGQRWLAPPPSSSTASVLLGGGRGRNFSFTRVLRANPVAKAGSLFPLKLMAYSIQSYLNKKKSFCVAEVKASVPSLVTLIIIIYFS